MKTKWSWLKFVIVFAICIIAGVIGRCTANYSFQKEHGSLSNDNNELLVDSDSIQITVEPIEEKPVEKQASTRKVNIITIKKQYTIQAAVFRAVGGYYKNVNRKETIRPVLLSNGRVILKKYLNDRLSTCGHEELTSIPGYEYQIVDVVNNNIIIYVYNESDKK